MACALSAGAQGIYQFEDPGFEKAWENAKEPGHGWHSFASANTSQLGIIGGFAQSAAPAPERVSGESGGYAVFLKSINVSKNANGNLTTGRINMGSMTPNDPKNYNYSEMNGQCLQFSGIPDAVKFKAKFKAKEGNGNTGDEVNNAPAGRGQFILHKATTGNSEYKDPEDDAFTDYRVAKASVLINRNDDQWHPYSGEFKYDKTSEKEVLYMLASFTTNPHPGESKDDELTIDDVYFVYYSDLKSLTYNGQTLDADALSQLSQEDGKIKIDFSSEIYDPDKLSYELKGQGATAKGTFDKFTSTVTLTVYGNDYGQTINGEVSDNKTVYVLQFKKPGASEIEKITKKSYNSLVKVTLGDLVTPSINTIEIEDAKDGTVNFRMNDFQFMGSSLGNVVLPNAVLYYYKDNSIRIAVSDFPLTVGDSNDPSALHTKTSLDGSVNEQEELSADLVINWYPLGDINDPNADPTGIKVNVTAAPFTTTTSDDGNTLTVTGDVAKDLVSLVVPANADVNAIDLTRANLESEMATSAFGVKNSNTLFYVNAEENNLTGDNNIVKGTECENFVLTDGLTFNAPKGFEATNVTFNREFKAGQLSTVVLPFSFDVANVNGTVYKLKSVENGVLSFKSVEGTAEANVPYLVQTEGDNLFKTETPKNVTVAQTPETVENSITGTGVTHVGNFGETMNIASDDQTSWYGYTSEGKFVKVSDGTIKPFRTAIKSTSATTQNSFALKLDGTLNGILNLENPNAKVDVYTISGVCVRKNVPAASALNGLSRGVYIVGGQKVVK